jgi:DNA replication and repair protein RecF
MYDPLFFDDLRRYRSVLRQRNAAIKDGYASLIPVYDVQLAKLGMAIQKRRAEEVVKFNELFVKLYQAVSQTDERMYIAYKPSWGDCTTEEEARTSSPGHSSGTCACRPLQAAYTGTNSS